jgi:uncharacterized YccA/Bax inhibitor family protein
MIKEKLEIFIRRLSEATPSCLMMMVQGNAFALTFGHWIKALQVGATTGLLAVLVSFSGRKELQENKYVIAGLTGFLTAISDFLLHPSHFGGVSTEAIATGIGAGLLCLALSNIGKK